MNVDEMRTLYAFNRWATDRILRAVRLLSPEEFTRDLRTSHGSVRGTLVHTLWAEWIWLKRWTGESPKLIFDEGDFPDVVAVEARWHDLDRERQQFVATLTDDRLRSIVAYENMRGEHWEYPLVHAMQHVANHASYHRGQVVALLRQLGKTPPSTDFLEYFDEGGREEVAEFRG
jgi:uncharacterized damage-inducible protein DinB